MSKINEQFKSYFTDKYKPASSEKDANLQLSTVEFYKRIDKSFPGLFTPNQLVDFLSEQKFKFTDIELEFEWLIAMK